MKRKSPAAKKQNSKPAQEHAATSVSAGNGVSNPIQSGPTSLPRVAHSVTPDSSTQTDTATTLFQRAELFQQAAELTQAAETYMQALTLKPDHWQALGALGRCLTGLCNYPEALNAFSLALQAAPTPYDNVDNLFHLGQLYKKIRHFEKALECYDYILRMQPNHPETLIALSQVYRQLGRTEQAIEIHDRQLLLQPDNPSLLISKALSLPVLYDSVEDVQTWRNTLAAQIDTLLQMEFPENRKLALHGSSFYLAYQGLNDRVLAEKIGRIFQKFLPSMAPVHLKPVGKPRIGIISRFLSPQHTVGRFMQGIIEHLSRDYFEIITFSVGNDHAYLPQQKKHPNDRIVVLPSDNIETAARQILEHQPDLLLYADIGMNVTTYCLAGLRLAPVQCVTWGHPVTSGLSTIDYFISSHLVEQEAEIARTHYSEKVVLLNTLPTYYYRPPFQTEKQNRSDFGLPETANLYVCPQSLFKFHPDFDPVLAAILRQDPQGALVLISHYTEAVNEQLRARWAKTMPDVLSRVHFLPRLERQQFLTLLQGATVILDPLHFGGGNTTYEALGLGVPVVTCPGPYMRGRVTAGCYQKMGLSTFIAQTTDEYIALAFKWGTQPEQRSAASQQIMENQSVLFEDPQVIEELEAFFKSVLSKNDAQQTL